MIIHVIIIEATLRRRHLWPGIGSGILFQCRAAREGDFAPTFEMPYDKLVGT